MYQYKITFSNIFVKPIFFEASGFFLKENFYYFYSEAEPDDSGNWIYSGLLYSINPDKILYIEVIQ